MTITIYQPNQMLGPRGMVFSPAPSKGTVGNWDRVTLEQVELARRITRVGWAWDWIGPTRPKLLMGSPKTDLDSNPSLP